MHPCLLEIERTVVFNKVYKCINLTIHLSEHFFHCQRPLKFTQPSVHCTKIIQHNALWCSATTETWTATSHHGEIIINIGIITY